MESTSVAPRRMSLHLLEEITDGFSNYRKVGSGSYGSVYKGEYKSGETIAVKLLHHSPGNQDEKDMEEYLNVATRQHKNVVRLVGYCHETRRELQPFGGKMVLVEVTKRALCFEYMHNGSLDQYLSDQFNGLDWQTRYAIIKGICQGLKYLHEDLISPMYHLDLKPANVLLDENMVPKLADFAVSRLFGGEQTEMTTSSIGTIGYVPPEFIDAGIISNKFDIFSLGWVIIKIMTGPRGYYRSNEMSSQEFIKIVDSIWTKRLRSSSVHLLDSYSEQVKRCIEIALSCVDADRYKRPSIGLIISKLNALKTPIESPEKDIGSSTYKSHDDGESTVPSEIISTLFSSLEITDQETELKTLVGILIDANAKPARLSYPFVKSITRNFSQEIGRGGFSIVYLGHLGTQNVAVKKLSISQGFSDILFVEEINCLLKTKHDNVVRFLGYCADTHGELVPFNRSHVLAEVPQRLLCFEYAPNGSLQKYLKDKSRNNEWQVQYQIIRGICHGLNYLHDQRINHLDLKPGNILLGTRLEPKITDFGLSRCFDEGVSRVYTKIVRGTPGSIAPEMIDNGEITFKSDIYGLGIIIIKILTRSNDYDFENWHTSIDVDGPQVKSCIEIAQRCVSSDKHKRPTMCEIMQKLNEIEKL